VCEEKGLILSSRAFVTIDSSLTWSAMMPPPSPWQQMNNFVWDPSPRCANFASNPSRKHCDHLSMASASPDADDTV
jgi:hypothetical protein